MTDDRDILAAAGVALAIIAEVSREKLAPGAEGERPCPVCGGRIRWIVGPRRRGYRRREPRVAGACETLDCVAFG